MYQSIKLGNLPALECLCDTGINLDNLRDNHGYSPITFAAKLGNLTIANYISLRVKNIDDEDPEGLTAFSREVLRHGFEQASKYLQRSANINFRNRDGKTTLTLALVSNNESAVKFLLGKGAELHFEDLTGKDSCDYAKQSQVFTNYNVF